MNSFQRTMVQWNDLHAYNAVHMVRITGGLDAERLTGVVNEFLEQRGLTNLTMDAERGAYDYAGGCAGLQINVVAGGAQPLTNLAAEAQRQLNSAFNPSECFTPFRFFAVPETGGFWLGLVYFHAIADAEAIVLLLKDMVDARSGNTAGGRSEPMELYPERHDHLLRRHPQVFVRRVLGLPAQVRNVRSSFRAHYQDAGNLDNGLSLFSVEPELWRDVIATGKGWGVTVNDLLLALLLQALSPLACNRAKSPRRRQLSLGCIVNIRKDLGVDSRRLFGLFLGSFRVSHPVPDGMSVRKLAEDLNRQTQVIKRQRLYLGAPLELGFGRLMFSFFSPERRQKLYQKNYPLWGGITNMNLNTLWPVDEEDRAKDYFRAVSTGPATPLVLSVTTVGDHANIALSYRTTVFPEPAIEQIKSSFLHSLAELGTCA